MSLENEQDQAPATSEAPENVTERAAETADPVVDVRTEAVQEERSRVSEIRRAVRTARMSEQLSDELITTGASLNESRARIIEEFANQDTSEEVNSVRTSVDSDVIGRMREDAAAAILSRGGVGAAPENTEFTGMSLLRLCEDLLGRQGVSTRGMHPQEIATRALSTSDLANITGSVMNRSLLMGYESAPRTFVGVFRQASAQDFRAINRVRLSDAPSLDEVKAGGEFEYGSVSDEKESYQLVTYGKILPFTRQTIINDDLDALIRVPTMFGRAGADKESDIVWGIVTANAALQDGTALFHSDHANLAGSGAAIDVTTLGAARSAMRKQTSIAGRLINVMPRHVIVGADAETTLDQFLSQITPATQSSAIPSTLRTLNPVVEPRLSGNAWYVAADYNQIDTIEYAYLSGSNGVYIETREGFNVDGIEIKARHDFAAKAIDYRGLYKNPGQ